MFFLHAAADVVDKKAEFLTFKNPFGNLRDEIVRVKDHPDTVCGVFLDPSAQPASDGVGLLGRNASQMKLAFVLDEVHSSLLICFHDEPPLLL